MQCKVLSPPFFQRLSILGFRITLPLLPYILLNTNNIVSKGFSLLFGM